MSRLINKIRKNLKSKKGFTLLEVLVSIALIGIVLPLTFELFNLGANLMSKSKQMVNVSSDVAYVVDSSRAVEGVTSSGTGVPTSGKIIVEYDNLTGVNNETDIDYTSKKKGDVVYYTYTP